jgi:hypothetical protein
VAVLLALHAGGQTKSWESIGLKFDGFSCYLADVALEIHEGAPGLTGWTIAADHPGVFDVDGIATTVVAGSDARAASSPCGTEKITGLDHVVVNTDNLDRTCNALCHHLGVEVRRERDAGRGVVQRFIKLSNTIIEVVTGPHITTPGASLWGMVISVDNMETWAAQCGPDVASVPKQATQPGRLISTVRSGVGLGVPFAVMTPHVNIHGSSAHD